MSDRTVEMPTTAPSHSPNYALHNASNENPLLSLLREEEEVIQLDNPHPLGLKSP